MKSTQTKLLALLFLAVYAVEGALYAIATNSDESISSQSLPQLEQRLVEIDSELESLSKLTFRDGVGNLGWISNMKTVAPTKEWAQIDLGEPSMIDQIVLAPVIWRGSKAEYQADCFPCKFKITAGTGEDSKGQIVAEFSHQDNILPRVAPLVISFEPISASWVRIEAKTEQSKVWDVKYCVQLSEAMVFSGDENIALNRPVLVSSAQRDWVAKAMYKEALTDGLMPYLMNAAEGSQSDPYIAFYKDDIGYSLIVDLEETLPVNEVYLHAADIRENTPRIYHADYAMPRHLVIEGATLPDFSDAVLLTEYIRTTIYETGPILMLRFPETACRYVRLTAVKAYGSPEANNIWRCVGFAEIELLSKGRNIAFGKTPQDNGKAKKFQGQLANLTDGLNHYGQILPVKEWLNELARRHDLELERPLVAAELNNRYIRQKITLGRMKWLSALLASGILLTLFIDQFLKKCQIARLKERFAADLHDELGANLHSIGLLSDVAQDAESVSEWQELSKRIRELTERTGKAIRHCTNLLESKDLYIGLTSDMQRAADRIATNLKHDIKIEGDTYLDNLKPRTRVDLFLFYKECLVNICRHSGATEVATSLIATRKDITLAIKDNGSGLQNSKETKIPASLKRRARLLNAKLRVESHETGGTCISLKLRQHWWLHQHS